MSKRKSVMPTFRELMDDLKPMTFGEKLDHLWTYYKEYVFIALVLALLAVAACASAAEIRPLPLDHDTLDLLG